MAVTNGFAHADGIRDHALGLECPPVAADPAKPDLNLIGQAQPTFGSHHGVHLLEVVFGQKHLPRHARDRLGNEKTGALACLAHGIQLLCHRLGKALAVRFHGPVLGGVVAVRDYGLVNMRRPALTRLALVLVRAQIDQFLRGAVVGPVQHDRLITACVIARHTQHQAVGLTPRAAKGRYAKALWQSAGQAFGVFDDIVVQVAGIGVEQRSLAGQGLDHVGMTMAQVADVVEAVQVGPPEVVDQPYAIPAHEFDRIGV